MQRDIRELRERLDSLDRRDVDINEQVARLKKVLDQATSLLSRNSADIGTKVAKNEGDIAMVNGQVEEARHLLEQLQKQIVEQNNRLASIEQTQTKIVERVAPTLPEDKETLWREAQSRMASGSRDDARRFLRSFTQRFPQDARVPQALLILGQSFAVEGKHTQAVAEYLKVMDTYRTAPEVPESMWLMAQSYAELKFCSDSIAVLTDLTKRYPKSARVNDAKTKLRELNKIARDKRLCSS